MRLDNTPHTYVMISFVDSYKHLANYGLDGAKEDILLIDKYQHGSIIRYVSNHSSREDPEYLFNS
jgi:hypothetical protein